MGAYSFEYGYDKVGNRTSLSIEAMDTATEISVGWTYEYNTLNQLKKRYDGASWTGADGDTRWSYEYDKNGNLTWATKQVKESGSWNEKLQWQYTWNPRDQLERVDKFVNGLGIQDAYVEYRYCLSCDGALSERIEHGAYSGGSHPIVSWQRYEYHGLDLARVDERYDSNSSGTLTSADAWRTLEVSSHRPGAIGSLLGKRVYTHTNNDATPDQTDDFFYTYDPVGNVVSVMDDNGNEAYHFTQEAFGNELPVNVLGGTDWDDAADDRIVEHQTGKWKDEFTGLYYFWARWYDGEVGRFVGRDPVKTCRYFSHPYTFARNRPLSFYDRDGRFEWDLTGPYPCCAETLVEMREKIEDACDHLAGILLEIEEEGEESRVEVKECVLGRCREGKVQCRTKCPKGSEGGTQTAAGWENKPGVLQPIKYLYVCVDKKAGATAIHEWGHECGCDHSGESSNDGDYEYYDGLCGFLPGDGNNHRGF